MRSRPAQAVLQSVAVCRLAQRGVVVARRAQRAVYRVIAAAPDACLFVAGAKSLIGSQMLFGKRKQVVKRILIVEDEPLTAFDNENILGDAGYEIVATVDDLDEALEALEHGRVHLVLSDVRLKDDQTGIRIAKAAKQKNIPTLFATGHSHPLASELAVGCLHKPYSGRQLIKAIECVDRHLQGEKVIPPKGLEIFVASLGPD
jgi:CheY-like chemotaxis protein